MSAEPTTRSADADLEPAIQPVADGDRDAPVTVHLAATRERAYDVRVHFGVVAYSVHVTGGPFLSPDCAIEHARQRVCEWYSPTPMFTRGEVVSE